MNESRRGIMQAAPTGIDHTFHLFATMTTWPLTAGWAWAWVAVVLHDRRARRDDVAVRRAGEFLQMDAQELQTWMALAGTIVLFFAAVVVVVVFYRARRSLPVRHLLAARAWSRLAAAMSSASSAVNSVSGRLSRKTIR